MANANSKVPGTYLDQIAQSINNIIDQWVTDESEKLTRSLEADLFFRSVTVADLSFDEHLILHGLYVKMSDPSTNLFYLDENGGSN